MHCAESETASQSEAKTVLHYCGEMTGCSGKSANSILLLVFRKKLVFLVEDGLLADHICRRKRKKWKCDSLQIHKTRISTQTCLFQFF